MNLQEALALGVVGLTAAAFLIAALRRHYRGAGAACSGDCSCPAARQENGSSPAARVETPRQNR